MIPVSLALFVPLNKKTLTFIFIISPLLVWAMKNQFTDLLLSGFESETGELGNVFSRYSEREMASSNWKGIIVGAISYARFYILFFFISKVILSKKQSISSSVSRLYAIVIVTMIICHSLLILTSNSYTLYYRYLYMTMIPMCLIWTAFFRDDNITSRDFYKMAKFELICSILIFVSGSISYL